MEMLLARLDTVPVQPSPYDLGLYRADTPVSPTTATVTTTDWQQSLPVLCGAKVVLRELRASDAASLLMMLTTEEVARFISPPPTTVDGFERFIAWTHRMRREGQYACFAVVPEGLDTAIGIFQFRSLEAGFASAEWGFALGSAFWGTGMFQQGAALTLGFAFDQVGVRRLEARSTVDNARGNAALTKIGAVQAGLIRQTFFRDGRYHDQILWSLVATDWRTANGLFEPYPRGVPRPPIDRRELARSIPPIQ